MISGLTQVVAVMGTPIFQVTSPGNFNHYFQTHRLNKVMVPVDLAAEQVKDFLNALRGWHNMSGVLVTVPHKQWVAALVDSLTPRARQLGAVNVVRKQADGSLYGDMLDGEGFVAAAADHGFSPQGKRALVVGCGGVGCAIAWALCEAGLVSLALHDLDPQTVDRLKGKLQARFPGVTLSSLPASLNGLDLVANGSPAGMKGYPELPLPGQLLATLNAGTLVADVVTAPAITPLLTLAAQRGCRVQTGHQMAAAQMQATGEFIGAIPKMVAGTR